MCNPLPFQAKELLRHHFLPFSLYACPCLSWLWLLDWPGPAFPCPCYRPPAPELASLLQQQLPSFVDDLGAYYAAEHHVLLFAITQKVPWQVSSGTVCSQI
jgi:hypothetical protein